VPVQQGASPQRGEQKSTASTPKDTRPKRATLSDTSDLVRALYYADPGNGKTTAIAHMAKLGYMVHIDPEKRLKAGPLKKLGVPTDNIEPFYDTSYEALEQLAFDLRERLSNGEKIVGLGWDAAGEAARQFTQTLVDKGVMKAASVGKERNPYATELSDYGDMTEQMRRILRRFKDLPIHLALAAHIDRSTDENGAVRLAPAFTPAVGRDMMGYMDVVVHCRIELVDGEEEYSGLCRPYGQYTAKDAFGVMPRVLVDPTFDRIVSYVRGDLTSATDPKQQAAKAARERAAEKIKADNPAA